MPTLEEEFVPEATASLDEVFQPESLDAAFKPESTVSVSSRPIVPSPGEPPPNAGARPPITGMMVGQPLPSVAEQTSAEFQTPEQQAIQRKLDMPRINVPAGVMLPVTKAVIGTTPLIKDLLPLSTKAVEGISEAARKNAEAATSISGMAQLPYMAVGGLEGAALRGVGMAGKALGAAFGAMGAEQAVTSSSDFMEAVKRGDTKGAAEAASQAILGGAMATGGALSLRGHTFAYVPEERQLTTGKFTEMPELSGSTYENAALRVEPAAPPSRQLMAPRTRMPEFAQSTIEPEGTPPKALPAPGESTAAGPLMPTSPLAEPTVGHQISLPLEPETAAKARKVWSKPIDPEAQLEGAEALRQLVKFTEERKTPGEPYQPPVITTDLRQLERMMQRNTVSKVESWADDVIQNKLHEAGANPYFDPEFLAAAGVKATILFKRGVTNFAEWSQRMKQQFGAGIEPQLETLYKTVSQHYQERSKDATRIREDAGQVPPIRNEPQERPSQGGENLERNAQVQPGGTAQKKAQITSPAQPAAESEVKTASRSAPPIIESPPIIHESAGAFLKDTASEAPSPGFKGWLRGMAGESMPKTTMLDRASGEAGVRWASSHIAAPFAAKAFHESVLQGGVDPVRFGAALTEDNLRSVRAGFEAKGEPEKAAAVGTLIGQKGSPFPTEEAYQAYLASDATKAAIARHIAMWNEHVEPMYRRAAMIDPDVELSTRGAQTGARINLHAITEGAAPARTTASAGARLTATFQKKSPFAREATGTGNYGVDYRDIMSNTYARQLDIANQNDFNKKLVASGNAVIGPPGMPPTIAGEGTTAFPLKRTQYITRTDEGTSTFSQAKNIYVRNSIADEYMAVANPFGASSRGGKLITKLSGGMNKMALAGLTDFTVHMSNLATILTTRPASGNVIADILLSTAGRSDLVFTGIKALAKGLSNNTKQLAQLAEIGALRQSGAKHFTGKAIEWADRTVRLVMDDTYQQLAKNGYAEKSETARREFVNQAGQYNKRLQGRVTAALREYGVSPFITAGKTFNTLGVRNMLLDPGVKGGSPLLRVQILSKWVGTVGTLGVLNFLLTSNQEGGGVMGRPGVPLGRLDTGLSDEDGRPLTIPFLDILGFGRGLRVTGVRGTADALRFGLPLQTALDSGVRDVVNSAVGPLAGPGPRFALGAASGYPTAINVGRQFPVVQPGENQHFSDFAHALGEANPIVGSILDLARPGGSTSAALTRQLPRFSLQPSRAPEMMENYAEIVRKAQLYTYTDDLIRRARKMNASSRTPFIEGELEKLPDEDRDTVTKALQHRKITW